MPKFVEKKSKKNCMDGRGNAKMTCLHCSCTDVNITTMDWISMFAIFTWDTLVARRIHLPSRKQGEPHTKRRREKNEMISDGWMSPCVSSMLRWCIIAYAHIRGDRNEKFPVALIECSPSTFFKFVIHTHFFLLFFAFFLHVCLMSPFILFDRCCLTGTLVYFLVYVKHLIKRQNRLFVWLTRGVSNVAAATLCHKGQRRRRITCDVCMNNAWVAKGKIWIVYKGMGHTRYCSYTIVDMNMIALCLRIIPHLVSRNQPDTHTRIYSYIHFHYYILYSWS